MEVFLIYPKSEQAQKELAHELAKFHAEQALKNILKLPCSTEQKLELVDAVVKFHFILLYSIFPVIHSISKRFLQVLYFDRITFF